MKKTILCLSALLLSGQFVAAQPKIPEPLKPWTGWAVWDDTLRDSPRSYLKAETQLPFWPSALSLSVRPTGGSFTFNVTAYAKTTVPLPTGAAAWPVKVRANGAAVPVLERNGGAVIQLTPGVWKIEGGWLWNDIPQTIGIPREIGILTLTLDGQVVESPVWEANGTLWLRKEAATEEAVKDFLDVKIYSLLSDGNPLWLQSEIELTVTGRSREEQLGVILPEGWKLSNVESPIPVAVDERGQMKAQVRTGKWTVRVTAFRIDNPQEFRFAQQPGVEAILIAFRAKPDFRMTDVVGPLAVDASQTTFPQQWRNFPLYRWETNAPFGLKERMRGLGSQRPAGLAIERQWWLDENGGGITYRDNIGGVRQQIWRLDAVKGQTPGSVRANGEGQLITRNPQTGDVGVEVRDRQINLEATGRMENVVGKAIVAGGWHTDTDSLRVVFNLPSGWRLLAVFGADYSFGDWLTGWRLYDVFLLLLFTVAVGRLWGAPAGVVAFLAFGISYHEYSAPIYSWLLLLIPLALLRVVKEGAGRKWLLALKWALALSLMINMTPFIFNQIQKALYPQLERVNTDFYSAPGVVVVEAAAQKNAFGVEDVDQEVSAGAPMRMLTPTSSPSALGAVKSKNLNYDAKARIQTGPAVPLKDWRSIRFGWNGPVKDTETVRPILLPPWVTRPLALAALGLQLLLAAMLLNFRGLGAALLRSGKTAALVAALLVPVLSASAQTIPDKDTLETLRARLNAFNHEAFPNAASVPLVSLTLDKRKVAIEAEVHAGEFVAVPIPARLAAWSPVRVTVDGKPEPALRRDGGYLWVALAQGVHQVKVEGLLADVSDWEWTFLLKPHRVKINAPGWTVTGVRSDGTPEQQVFFTRLERTPAGAAAGYDRQDYQSLVVVERRIELGLRWQIQTTVRRLTADGKAISLRLPLLPGESVISDSAQVRDGHIEVRMSAGRDRFEWTSELAIAPELKLQTQATDTWVEQWQLVASPVWNIELGGLAPVFTGDESLIPTWHPWPGEGMEVKIGRPEAVLGATVTINEGTHTVVLGKRQRTSSLALNIRTSMAEDFLIELPKDAEITDLKLNGQTLPVRQADGKVTVPLQPGDQTVLLAWKTARELGLHSVADTVRLPVESANITTTIKLPDDRWTLWTHGPQRGPAVRFWMILAGTLVIAGFLGRMTLTPLRTWQWMLLCVGLMQMGLIPALLVIAWLFGLAWRGQPSFAARKPLVFNFLQLVLLGLTITAVIILLMTVYNGLLGNPNMFVTGNRSTRTVLHWYQARSGLTLPAPGCLTLGVWFYRALMLAWALWLAAALLRWLTWGWKQFSRGGVFRKKPAEVVKAPPPLP